MALLTKKDVAAQCCMETNKLSVYIGRHKLNVIKRGTNAGMIDTSDPVNSSFLKMYAIPAAGIAYAPAGKVGGKRQPKVIVDDDDLDDDLGIEVELPVTGDADENGILPVHESDKRYKHFLAIKTESAAALDHIKIEKLKGIVIPSALIQPVFLQHNQHILQEQKNVDDEMLATVKHKYDMDGVDVAWIRGEWLKLRNEAVSKATEMSLKAIETIVNDFSESRGRGERK